jgi:hypothetical protein
VCIFQLILLYRVVLMIMSPAFAEFVYEIAGISSCFDGESYENLDFSMPMITSLRNNSPSMENSD